MIHQTVNLRTGNALIFGDPDEQHAFEAECARARAAQVSRYAVAPRQLVVTHDGRRLGAGARVRLSDFTSDASGPAWAKLESLVRGGVVLEHDSIRDDDNDGPEAA